MSRYIDFLAKLSALTQVIPSELGAMKYYGMLPENPQALHAAPQVNMGDGWSVYLTTAPDRFGVRPGRWLIHFPPGKSMPLAGMGAKDLKAWLDGCDTAMDAMALCGRVRKLLQ